MKAKNILITVTMMAAVLVSGSQYAGATPKKPAKKAKQAAKAKKQPVHPTKYSARAVGVNLENSITGAEWRLANVKLHPHGGSLDVVAGATNLADLLSVGGAHVSVSGIGGISTSRAEVTNFSTAIVQDGVTNVLAFTYAVAEARAECGSNGLVLTASSQVQGLTINGVPVTVTGETNQVVAIPGGTLVLNAQVTSSSGNGKKGESSVAALFLSLTNGLEATIAYAEADVKCGSRVPPEMRACDKITGGGFVHTSSVSTNGGGTNTVSHGGFSVMAGNKHGLLVGKLNYIDHGAGIQVTSINVTGFSVVDLVTRAIDFNVLIDGVPGTARVLVADNGEPGRNDIFDITLSTGYHAGGTLGGGNIQLHKCPPGWAR
jgi:hypothetical protein